MFSKKEARIYKIINEIQKSVQNDENFDEAVKNGINLILKNSLADYAIIWYKPEDCEFLKAYYWNIPSDLTNCSYSNNEDIVLSRVLNSSTSELIEYSKCSESDKGHILHPFHSLFCLPFNLQQLKKFGCVEFVKVDSEFTEEEKDVFEILTLLTETIIDDSAPIPKKQADRNILLSVQNITKSFGSGANEITVLNDCSFNIYEGEFLVIVGESGCGKTTMLNIIGGLLKPNSGSVEFESNDIVGLNKKELTNYRRNNIGFIFQYDNLMPILTAKENLMLIDEISTNPLDPMEALKMVGLEDKADSYPSELSRGQQQRVSIARALMKKQKLILADEPTAALDYHTSIQILKIFEDIVKKRKTTLIMVTHNNEIAKMADRVIRIKKGKISETYVNLRVRKAEELEW